MDSKKQYVTGNSQFGESRFQGFFSQSKSVQSGEPTPKKPKLDIAKHGTIPTPKASNCASKSLSNKLDAIDDEWGDESDFDLAEMMAQVEHDETIAVSQMTPLTASSESGTVIKVETSKNSPRVPLRRVGSSQWPSSSSTFMASHPSNAGGTRKNPVNAAFLHSDIEKLRSENQKIKEELNKKAGEARILREKVNSSEKEKDKIKREYSSKMDTLKAEAERSSSSLMKEIGSLRGQLDVKNMEIKTAERRLKISSSVNRIQPDSPNRLGASLRSRVGSSSRGVVGAGLPLRFLRGAAGLELLEPSPPETPVTESLRTTNPRLFSGVLGPSARRELPAPHTCLTPCVALLLSPSLVDITSDHAQRAVSQAVEVCHKILKELLGQLESASGSTARFTERERELLTSGSRQLPLDREYDLLSHRELHRDERGVLARRALGLLSLLVQASDFAAKQMLSSNLKESTDVLDIVRNIVRQVEKQRRTLMFQGVLAGSVVLIKNLLKSETVISKETQALVLDILRWVVAARPGSLVVGLVLETLVAAAGSPLPLCHNSAEKTYKENTRHSIVQFTPDSCVLQVLCSLLLAAATPRKLRLTDLLTRWVLSQLYGGRPLPQWLLSAAPTAKSCRCHSLVFKLCFSLLSEACFTYPTVRGEDQRLVGEVLARGVLLTNAFMNDDQHLMAVGDQHSLGCYEHFLHVMGDASIALDTNTRDILELCKQEEVVKPPGNSTSDGGNSQLQKTLSFFKMGDNGKTCPDILDALESL